MPGLSTENSGSLGRILGEARCPLVGQGIKGKPSSSTTTLAPPGVFRVPVPPEPRALQPQTCVLPPGGRGSAAPPASRPPLPGTFLGTSGGAGPPGWVELLREEGKQDTPPTSPGQNFPAQTHPSSCLCCFACCLRLTHSGPYTASPNPEPLPLSWVPGTLLDTRQIWPLVCSPAEF